MQANVLSESFSQVPPLLQKPGEHTQANVLLECSSHLPPFAQGPKIHGFNVKWLHLLSWFSSDVEQFTQM